MTILAVALSGRALAAAASRAGEPCLVIDLFGDDDTRQLAQGCTVVPGDERTGFERDPLLAAVAALRGRVSGILAGAGFEDVPDLLARLAETAPLIGNSPEVVARIKDPFAFAALLARLGLPHPETRGEPPDGSDWLTKRAGASGGGHIQEGALDEAAGRYYQRRVAGRPVAALFAADGQEARLLGLSEQWTDPAPDAPFRYGGCAAPAQVSAVFAARVAEACSALAGAAGLVGLNSLDMLVEGERFHVLEVNPRPGATLDIFDGFGGLALWRLHCDAAAGRLPAAVPTIAEPRAAAVVYAAEPLRVPPGMSWPDWAVDRSASGSLIPAGAPVCTVRATAEWLQGARLEVERRRQVLLAMLPAA